MTDWEAYRLQAASDFAVFRRLSAEDRGEVPECHVLHYLQMATEKVAKAAFLKEGKSKFDRGSHVAFSRLRTIMKRRDIASRLGYQNFTAYREFLVRAQPLCRAIDELNPAVGPQRLGGGPKESENCEYPWWGPASGGGETWHVPAEHRFGLLERLQEAGDGARLLRFIEVLTERLDGVFR